MVSLRWRQVWLFIGLYLAGSSIGQMGFTAGVGAGINLLVFVIGCGLISWSLLDK